MRILALSLALILASDAFASRIPHDPAWMTKKGCDVVVAKVLDVFTRQEKNSHGDDVVKFCMEIEIISVDKTTHKLAAKQRIIVKTWSVTRLNGRRLCPATGNRVLKLGQTVRFYMEKKVGSWYAPFSHTGIRDVKK